MDLTVRNERKYSLEIRDMGDAKDISTGSGLERQIEKPEGVHEKFQYTLMKYVTDYTQTEIQSIDFNV